MSKQFAGAQPVRQRPAVRRHLPLPGGAPPTSAARPGTDRTFTTFSPPFTDPCPNAHVRQQTGAALLLDCRAYELVSAANTGGYDVESDLVAGQTPFGGYPEAGHPRVLYAVHDGGIPGTGNPTNHGLDPYVATRTAARLEHQLRRHPRRRPRRHRRPSPRLLGRADASLDTFAFGGPDICSPCFADGTTGIPVRMPDGSLVQGMVGSLNPAPRPKRPASCRQDASRPTARTSSSARPPGSSRTATSTATSRSTDRNLVTGRPTSSRRRRAAPTMTGPGIAELDISADGSRILVGQMVSTDADGNHYWHLYMNVGDSEPDGRPHPGRDRGGPLRRDDRRRLQGLLHDHGPARGRRHRHQRRHLRADVSDGSGATLAQVSTGAGGAGNATPATRSPTPARAHWNSSARRRQLRRGRDRRRRGGRLRRRLDLLPLARGSRRSAERQP